MNKLFVLAALVACATAAAPRYSKQARGAGRIVGGEFTDDRSQFPFIVEFVSSTNFQFCAGSIIDENSILTAAHCCSPGSNSDSVVAGALTRIVDGPQGVDDGFEQEIPVTAQTIHPNNNAFTFAYDFCVLELGGSFQFNDYVAPVALATSSDAEAFAGENARVIGWGTREYGGTSLQWQHYVDVPVLSDDECRATGYSNSEITEDMICAGEPGKDACQGDSGGPMVCPDENGVQCGVVSWGYSCAAANYPGVYAEVAYAEDFINEQSR